LTRPESQFASSPDSEMNPLRNPLLAANMGRWAEVYFTTPPERRPQAIAELVRELQFEQGPSASEPPTIATAGVEANEPEVSPITQPVESSTLPALTKAEPLILCGECGHENPRHQRFCGMCGVPLSVAAPSADEELAVPARQTDSDRADFDRADLNSDLDRESCDSAPPSYASGSILGLSYAYENAPVAEEPMRDRIPESALSLPDRDLPAFATAQPMVHYRYRLYLGAGFLILLCTLIYMSWHGKRAFSGPLASTGAPSTQLAPAPAQPPAVLPTETSKNAPSSEQEKNQQETSQPRPPAHEEAQASANTPPPQEQPAVPQDRAPATQVPTLQAKDARTGRETVKTAAPRTSTQNRSERAIPATTDTGEQELATADRYLNGGSTRDSAYAALWLWKAVGKGNPAATVELSDLYLRGDGVSKNCDQARLLLYAAAGRGDKGAAVRLRNLPAFGCQ
jgi:hypothetical protein